MEKIRTLAHNPEMKGMVEFKANIAFAQPDGEALALQLVKPMWMPENGKGFPLVVFIQGSAWTKPDQFWEIPQLSKLAERGFVVASVTHRSCMTAPAPAFLVDVKSAIRFLRAHAEEYAIDPERVCAWGTSSGGNTALLLGMTGDDPQYKSEVWTAYSDSVMAVVDCFGPCDLRKMIFEQFKDKPEELSDIILHLIGGDPETHSDAISEFSPIERVTAEQKLPPMLILHGDSDELVLYEDSVALYEKLCICGHQVEMVRVEGAPHEGSFWSLPLLDIIFEFIEKQVG